MNLLDLYLLVGTRIFAFVLKTYCLFEAIEDKSSTPNQTLKMDAKNLTHARSIFSCLQGNPCGGPKKCH